MAIDFSPAGITSFLNNRIRVNYAQLASVALAVIDSLACLPQEVKYIWSSQWTLVKVLYLLSRYTMLVVGATSILMYSVPSATPTMCKNWFWIATVVSVGGIAITQALLYLRVFALAGRGKLIGWLLGLIFVGIHGVGFVFAVQFMNTVKFAPSPFRRIIPCLPFAGDIRLMPRVYTMILGSEIVILVITLWTCLTKYRRSKSPLIALFYRDGIGYFWCLSFVSAANMMCNLLAPPPYSYQDLFTLAQAMLHGMLSTRMILHIRQTATTQEATSLGSESHELSRR